VIRLPATDLRCSARGNALPDSKVAWRGFRVVLEA
jgi:formylglycine-generating enzyme required for sulfatase activity